MKRAAAMVLVLLVVGCAIAIGDKSNAQVRVNAPLEVDATAQTKRDTQEASAKP